MSYPQPGLGDSEVPYFLPSFCKEALLFKRSNLLFTVSLSSYYQGKNCRNFKKALGNVFIAESLGSYKNKQITEPTRETIVKSLHVKHKAKSPPGSLSYRRIERLRFEILIKLGNLGGKQVKFYNSGILTAVEYDRLLTFQT